MGFDNFDSSKDNFGLVRSENKGFLNYAKLGLGGAVGLLSSSESSNAQARAGMSSAGGMRVNASNMDAQASQVLAESAENGRRMRTNQARAVGDAAVMLGARGLTGDGSGGHAGKAVGAQAEVALNDAAGQALQNVQTMHYQASLARWEADQVERASRRKKRGVLGSIAGGAVGGYFGGSLGSSVGSQIGGRLPF